MECLTLKYEDVKKQEPAGKNDGGLGGEVEELSQAKCRSGAHPKDERLGVAQREWAEHNARKVAAASTALLNLEYRNIEDNEYVGSPQ